MLLTLLTSLWSLVATQRLENTLVNKHMEDTVLTNKQIRKCAKVSSQDRAGQGS